MDQISKKELLALTGISYGQLYRWKRDGLIPEEWFMKQSSYTGQETFFPREQILNRIRSILDMKGSHSLDELATILSPGAEGPTMELSKIEELQEPDRESLCRQTGKSAFSLPELSFLVTLKTACPQLSSAAFSELAAESLREPLESAECSCTVFSSGDKYHAAILKGPGELRFSAGVQVTASFRLAAAADLIRDKYLLKERLENEL